VVTTASTPAPDIWMNGMHVGVWECPKSVADRLTYEPRWINSPAGHHALRER